MNYLEKYFYNTCPAPAIEYHGLLNQGATCYLNSVLQVLFMSKDFREAVERHTGENPDSGCIDPQLTSLFGDLKGHTAYTYRITEKLGIDRVSEQRDAAEYFEKILSLTSPEASQIFHGLLTHKTTCSACRAETDTDGPFWHLPLVLVDSYSEDYSVVDGIEEYFRASYFSGENQMYCDQCDAKSDATIKCVMKRHPEVLMLLLKRFEFDYRYMTYVKINRTVVVPCTLQIPENQTYELYAVVEHFGDLRSGHYTAKIKTQDDERWYNFNDASVTSLDDQVDFERSHSAYLLFYRKKNVHAADNRTQGAMEVSTPGGFPPAASDVRDQCRDAEKMGERGEAEVAAEAGNATAVAVSIDRRDETGIIDIVGVGLSPDLCSNVGDQDSGGYARQSLSDNHQGCSEERNDLPYHLQDAHAEKQREERKMITGDEEEIGGNSEADDQAEKRGNLSRGSQLEESVDDRDNDRGRIDYVGQMKPDRSHYFKPEVSDRHAIHGRHHKQDEVSDAQRRDVDKEGKTGADERLEKTGRSLSECLDGDAKHQYSEGLDGVRQNINEDQGGTQDVGQDYDPKPASVDKQGDEERMERDVKVDKEGKTGADERGMASGGRKLTKYDLCFHNVGVGDSEQKMTKVDQRREQGSRSRYERCERQREEKRGVQGDKEQKRGDDKRAQWRETYKIKPHLSDGVEDRDKRGLVDVRQHGQQEDPEQKTSVTRTTHKGTSEKKQTDEQEKKRDEHVQNRADSSLRQAGSRRVTENQGVGSVEKTRQGRSEPQARTEVKEDAMEGGRGSKKSVMYREIESGIQISSETKSIRIESVEGTSRGGIESRVAYNEGKVQRTSDPKGDAKGFVSDTQVLAAMKTHEKRRRRWWPLSASRKQHRKEKNKNKKSHGCFSFFRKKRKNAEQASESD